MNEYDRAIEKHRLKQLDEITTEIENIIEANRMKMYDDGWGEAGVKAIDEFPTDKIMEEIKEYLKDEWL